MDKYSPGETSRFTPRTARTSGGPGNERCRSTSSTTGVIRRRPRSSTDHHERVRLQRRRRRRNRRTPVVDRTDLDLAAGGQTGHDRLEMGRPTAAHDLHPRRAGSVGEQGRDRHHEHGSRGARDRDGHFDVGTAQSPRLLVRDVLRLQNDGGPATATATATTAATCTGTGRTGFRVVTAARRGCPADHGHNGRDRGVALNGEFGGEADAE